MKQTNVAVLIILLSILVNAAVARKNISLTFAFDSTGSMSDDLAQVKNGTNRILNKFLAMGEKSPVRDYILVTFNDPNVSDAYVTTDVNKFKLLLSSFRVNGGGDCAEMCIGGIEKAAMASKRGSSIYVFTDASAKDYAIYPRVKSLLKAKDLKVVFVLTGDCGLSSSPQFQIYYSVANDTDGQVFNVKKSSVDSFMETLLDSIGSDEVEDTETDPSSTTNKKTVYFVIKPNTASLSIQVTAYDSAAYIKGNVFDPKGTNQSKTTGFTKYLIDQPNIYSVSKKNPVSGRWKLTIVSSTDKFNIKINVIMRETKMTTTKKPKPQTTTMKNSEKQWWMKLGFEYKRHHSGSYQVKATYSLMMLMLTLLMANTLY